MSGGTATQNINWNNLVEAINNDECVLVLGPNIATVEVDGKHTPLHQILAHELAEEIQEIQPSTTLLQPSNLSYIAEQLENALIANNVKEGRTHSKIRELIQAFYEKYDFTQFPVFAELAKLPFRFIVNTSPDNFLLEAYHEENKFAAESEFYHYRNPSHNNDIDKNDDFTAPHVDAPLIYNLFGSVENPDTLVITEADQLTFLDTILQQERTAGISNKIAMEFTSSKKKDYEKTYLFLGFDFNQWHLRLLIHLINRYEKQKEGYALQSPQSLSDLTTIFYKNNFEMEFVDVPPLSFAATFATKIQTLQPPSEASPKLKAVLIFDEKDQTDKETFDTHLALLKRNELIQAWDEEQLMAGSVRDEVIQEKLNQADIILLLVTPNLFSSDDIYEKQLRHALQQHQAKAAVVIPILMRSCLWQSSIIGSLSATILPGKNKTPLMNLPDPTTGLAETIKALENWCSKIYKRKNRK